jgi:SAM-dependent methyltransferase
MAVRKEHELLSGTPATAWFSARTVETTCAPLAGLLSPGMSVLDAGCGPGTITIDAAGRVAPGRVVGLDIGESPIAQAREHARETGVDNVEFVVGDATQLPFADRSFDLVYSNGMAEWLREPLRALREQVRVTRPGGRIVTIIGVPDKIIYPECPAFQRINEARKLLNNPRTEGMFYNGTFTNGAVSLFRSLGLAEITMLPYFPLDHVAYQGSEHFDAWRQGLLNLLVGGTRYRESRALAGIDDDVVEEARREIDAWHSHPDALIFGYRVFVSGRVPQGLARDSGAQHGRGHGDGSSGR